MKRQWLGLNYEKKFISNFPKYFMILLVFIVLVLPSVGQEDSAMLRFGHFVFDGLPVNLYLDGGPIVTADELAVAFSPMSLTNEYLELSADTHSFSLSLDGDSLEDSIITAEEFTFEAEHHYMLAFLGNVAADDLHFSLIDETAGIEPFDMSISAVTILINNVYGVPSLDSSLGDVPGSINVLYGDYSFAQDPVGVQGSKIFASGDPDTVIFEYSGAVASPSNTLAVFAFAGSYPGVLWEDYSEVYSVQYFGEMDIVDAGAIAVGDSVDVSYDAVGQRFQYTLNLEEATSLDIRLTSIDSTMGADSYLRIYNEAGDLILENDDLSEGNTDAGVLGLELDAGTYIIEAATFVDSGIGEFTLSISETE